MGTRGGYLKSLTISLPLNAKMRLIPLSERIDQPNMFSKCGALNVWITAISLCIKIVLLQRILENWSRLSKKKDD